MVSEDWRPVPGWEDRYMVSSLSSRICKECERIKNRAQKQKKRLGI